MYIFNLLFESSNWLFAILNWDNSRIIIYFLLIRSPSALTRNDFSHLASHVLCLHFRSTSGPLPVNIRSTSGLDSTTTSGIVTIHLFHKDEISFHWWDQFGCPPIGFLTSLLSAQWAKVGFEVFVRNLNVCPVIERPRKTSRTYFPPWDGQNHPLRPKWFRQCILQIVTNSFDDSELERNKIFLNIQQMQLF